MGRSRTTVRGSARLASNSVLQASGSQIEDQIECTAPGIIVEMSKGASKVGRAIDWEYLQKVVVSAEGKRELQALRRAYDDVAITIHDKFSSRPQSISWDFYKEKLGPSIVTIFEKSVNSLDKEVPEYECDFTEDYKASHRSLLTKAKEKEEDSKKKIIAIDKELARIRDEKEGLATITINEYYSKNPDVGAKIDDEIRNHIWE